MTRRDPNVSTRRAHLTLAFIILLLTILSLASRTMDRLRFSPVPQSALGKTFHTRY